MKKGELKSDLLTYHKMLNNIYKIKIYSAYDTCKSLKINSTISYYIYQLCLSNLKEITYDEVISYQRLLNTEYYNTIEQLYNDIHSKQKIIRFPNVS